MAGKIKLSPDDLLIRYQELGCNKSALARDQGVSVPAISKALQRAGVESTKEVKPTPKPKGGKPKAPRRKKTVNKSAADVAKAAVVSGIDPAARKRRARGAKAIDDERVNAMNSVAALETINRSLLATQEIQAKILEAIAESKNLKPFQVDLLMKTISTSSKLITDAHRIKKDLMSMDMATEWMKAVVSACDEESPEVVQRIFDKLISRGFAEQVGLSVS